MSSFSPLFALRALWQMQVKKRPFVLSHGINARCNLRCPFCSYWNRGGREMTFTEISSLLKDARSFGIGVYNAWTAEPLLREELPEILREAHSLGLVTSLVTNGQLLSKRIKELKDLDYLSVSLDGLDTYRRLRGASVEPVLEGIRAAAGEGHQVLINCVISGVNLDELLGLVDLAEELGVWISFEPLNEVKGIDGKVWEEMGIRDIPSYQKAIDALISRKLAGAPIINSLTYLRMIRSLEPRFNCHASDIVLHVRSDGTVENCRLQGQPLGHVSQGLAKVWESSREIRSNLVKDCNGCLFFGYVENSLLYDFNIEVMAHYRWM